MRCTDGTYKLNCEASTTLVYGVVDFNHHYHPAAIAAVSTEFDFDYETLECALKRLDPTYNPSASAPCLYTMQDFAGAIRKGQTRAITACKDVLNQVMCWRHTARASYKNAE